MTVQRLCGSHFYLFALRCRHFLNEEVGDILIRGVTSEASRISSVWTRCQGFGSKNAI